MKMQIKDFPIEPAAEFIAEFEGFEAKAYKCPAGVWTIGFGHTKGVKPGDTISRAEALALLADDLATFQNELAKIVRVPVTEWQFIALMSFIYNVGTSSAARSSAIKNLNAGAITAAADALLLWNKGGGKVLPGLTRRRKAERALFLEGL